MKVGYVMKIRRGYTLLELFIAVAVIAILMAFMLFSLSSSEVTARANNIILNLNIIGMAANTFYAQSHDELAKKTKTELSEWFTTHNTYIIEHYIEGGLRTDEIEKYDVIYDKDSGAWYSRYNIGTNSKTADLRYEIMDRAMHESELSGVYGYDGTENGTYGMKKINSNIASNNPEKRRENIYNSQRKDKYVILRIR